MFTQLWATLEGHFPDNLLLIPASPHTHTQYRRAVTAPTPVKAVAVLSDTPIPQACRSRAKPSAAQSHHVPKLVGYALLRKRSLADSNYQACHEHSVSHASMVFLSPLTHPGYRNLKQELQQALTLNATHFLPESNLYFCREIIV